MRPSVKWVHGWIEIIESLRDECRIFGVKSVVDCVLFQELISNSRRATISTLYRELPGEFNELLCGVGFEFLVWGINKNVQEI